jgi:hypothetical protein
MLNDPTIIANIQSSNIVFLTMDDHWCNGNLGNSDAWKLLKLWPQIEAYASGKTPAVYKIKTGKVLGIEEFRFSVRWKRAIPKT